jgi:hypothetical protein
MLEYWFKKMKTSILNEIEFLKIIIPKFHYKDIPFNLSIFPAECLTSALKKMTVIYPEDW